MVDRGAMTPNEWRETMNMAPLEGGDVPIRRLDTQVVNLIEDALKKMDKDNYVVVAGVITQLLNCSKSGGEENETQNQH